MSNLWEIVTGNSTLPVQPGNTLWDHLNNQKAGDGLPYPVPVVMVGVDNLAIDNYAEVGLVDNEAEVLLIKVEGADVTNIQNEGENA